MEFKKFFELLRKHRIPMMIIPVLVMVITFLMTKDKPNTYSSKARISAGIVDETQKNFLTKEDNMMENKVQQSFSNLIQMIQLKTVINQVSYQLILNDLTTSTPFKKPSKLLLDLNSNARKHAVEVYTKAYNNHQALSLVDKDQKGLHAVLTSMKYDYESIIKKFKVYRIESSDFIDMEYESESSQQSAFVVNAICKEFISYYTGLTKQNELKALNFVNALMKQKKDSLDNKMANLMNFKIQNRILSLNEQAKSLYAQLSEFETRLRLAQNEVISNKGAIEAINSRFNSQDKMYADNKLSKINKEIVSVKDKINSLNDDYIRNNFDNSIRNKIDSLRDHLSRKINQSTDRNMQSPQSARESMISQKMKMEVDLSLAENSIISLQNEIEKLNEKLDSLVPNEAVIQAFEGDIGVASQEYMDIMKKFNEVSLQYNSAIRIKQIEIAAPGEPQASKKIILVIVAGVVSFVIYFIVLFVLFYLDDSVKYPNDLEKLTKTKVLGAFPVIKSEYLNIQRLWDKETLNTIDKEFRNLLRNTRFEIHMAMKGGSILAVTSLRKEEGKTLFSFSLASAYQMVGKKVMLIDGNFIRPEITRISQAEDYIEDYLNGELTVEFAAKNEKLKIMGNKSSDATLFELNDEEWIKQKFNELKEYYDIIIIETASLETLNEAKEWIELSDCVIAIFEANTNITNEMKEHIAYLKNNGDKFIGWILNKVSSITYKVTEGKKAL